QGLLVQDPIGGGPAAIVKSPTIGAVGKFARVQRLVTAGYFDISKFRLGAPSAKADGSCLAGRSDIGGIDICGQDYLSPVLAKHLLDVVAGQTINTGAVEVDQVGIPLFIIHIRE